jgi:cyclohexyl-isocyanide hydratase
VSRPAPRRISSTLLEKEESTMNRRTLGKLAGSAATVAALQQFRGMQVGAQSERATPPASGQIGMLVFPGMTILDLIGPQQFFAVAPGRTTQLLWKTRDPVVSDSGVPILPTATFEEAPQELEILFVPGGFQGTGATIEDPDVLAFVASRGERATYVTSVCTGALILGAAGLLQGYRATTHWAYRDLLPLVGAEPVEARVVADRNRLTGGGVTSGIDFGLTLLARLAGEDYARGWQLGTEYDPHPPFEAGSPEQAGQFIEGEVLKVLGPRVETVRAALAGTPGYVGE